MTAPIKEQLYPELFGDSDNVREFPTGYIVKRYSTYDPNMCFIIDDTGVSDNVNWRQLKAGTPLASLRFDASTVLYLPGDWWVSKTSGCICFQPREDGEHILIAAYWGGTGDQTRGTEFLKIKPLAIYGHQGKSKNKGRRGVNYYVFERDWPNQGGQER